MTLAETKPNHKLNLLTAFSAKKLETGLPKGKNKVYMVFTV